MQWERSATSSVVWTEDVLEGFHRVMENMAHAHVGRGPLGRSVREPLVDQVVPATFAHAVLRERHLRVTVVPMV
jgi:hypothetical protein